MAVVVAAPCVKVVAVGVAVEVLAVVLGAIVVASVVALGRDGALDMAWISFLHVYNTVTSLMLTHLTDLARAFDVDFAINTEWGERRLITMG